MTPCGLEISRRFSTLHLSQPLYRDHRQIIELRSFTGEFRNGARDVRDQFFYTLVRVRFHHLAQSLESEIFFFAVDRIGYAIGIKQERIPWKEIDLVLLERNIRNRGERHAVSGQRRHFFTIRAIKQWRAVTRVHIREPMT